MSEQLLLLLLLLQDPTGQRYLVMPSSEQVTTNAKNKKALQEYMDKQVCGRGSVVSGGGVRAHSGERVGGGVAARRWLCAFLSVSGCAYLRQPHIHPCVHSFV